MIDGDPYETLEMDALRASQSRLLHLVASSDDLGSLSGEPEDLPAVGLPGRAELALRREAERCLEQHKDTLAAEERRQEVRLIKQLVNKASSRRDRWILDTAIRMAQRLTTPAAGVDDGALKDLADAVLLIRMADHYRAQGATGD